MAVRSSNLYSSVNWQPVKLIQYGTEVTALHRNAYQFLSACFRNLTNAINSTYYQAFTMHNLWESVVSEAGRGSPFILTGHTMQPDRVLNRILIGYFFWEVNAKT